MYSHNLGQTLMHPHCRAFVGFENYREAQSRGRAGQDCDALYYACPHSYKSSMFAKYFK